MTNTYQVELRGLMAPDFIREASKWGEQKLRADQSGCHPHIIRFTDLLIKKMAKNNVPMFCHGMRRTPEEQTRLFIKGVSNHSGTDGVHTYGMAADIIHSLKAWDLTEKQWDIIGHIGKELAIQNGFKLTWGGDWTQPWDPAHWEIANWRKYKGSETWPLK